ncbi:MAG: amidohydrolase [Spirochaetes bacterium]|nr:amidohydrolase [Spirochaetota bacterium]
MNEKSFDTLLRSVEGKVIEYRRDIHKHAESGWMEFYTASLVARELEKLGIEVRIGQDVVDPSSRMGVPDSNTLEKAYQRALREGADPKYLERMKGGFTGVVGIIGKRQGPTLGFRFDMDAVEIGECLKEEHLPTKLGFASIHPEAMHACGHDGHTAIGLGLANVLWALKDQLEGRVILLFQPAEEGARGAKAMMAAGVVDTVDFLFGIHIGVKATSNGEFYCGSDGFLATSKLDAHFQGHSVHAGLAPQDGRNALLAAATAVLNLHAIPRHGEGETRINVGRLVAGSGRNVIPADAYLAFETRGKTGEIDRYMREYAERILYHAASMHEVECKIQRMGEGVDATSDEELVDMVFTLAQKHKIFTHLKRKVTDFGGSEDFTHLMRQVQSKGGKTTYFMLGSNLSGNHHTKTFDFDESCLIKGVEILARLALEGKWNEQRNQS